MQCSPHATYLQQRSTGTDSPGAASQPLGVGARVAEIMAAASGVGAFAGFLSGATVASAASDGGNSSSSACPAYPWPQDGARGGHKAFMQHDCAACHSMLPYAGLAAAPAAEAEAKAAEIVVVHEAAAQLEPAPATTIHGGACSPCPPDLSVITRALEGLRRSNLYAADELRKRMALLPTPVWLQFLQPYMRNTQAART